MVRVKVEKPVSFCPQPDKNIPQLHSLLLLNHSNHQEIPDDIITGLTFTISHTVTMLCFSVEGGSPLAFDFSTRHKSHDIQTHITSNIEEASVQVYWTVLSSIGLTI